MAEFCYERYLKKPIDEEHTRMKLTPKKFGT